MSGQRSRRKGHDYERKIRLEFRQYGWKYCQTSRYASKLIDDNKIDMIRNSFTVKTKGAQKISPREALKNLSPQLRQLVANV